MAARDARLRRLLAVGDMASAAIALAFASVTFRDNTRVTAAALALIPLVVLMSKVAGLYDRDRNRLRKTTLDEAPALFQVATLFALVAYLGERVLTNGGFSRTEVLALWLALFLSMIIARAATRTVMQRLSSPERCLVLGDAESARYVQRKLESTHGVSGVLVGWVPGEEHLNGASRDLPVLGSIETLGIVLAEHEIQRAIIAPTSDVGENMLDTIRRVKALGVKVSVLPRLLEVVGSSVEFDELGGMVLLGVRPYGLPRSSYVLKRLLDLCAAAVMLLLLTPLLLSIAIVVKLSSRGPALFRQVRIGRDGRSFMMLKFRTMVDGADAMKDELRALNESDGLFKIADDPRLTRVGRFLRRTSLDELPQLINVLRGEMSLVGPRPLVPDEDRQVEGWLRRRLHVPPGITGPWQILGPSRVPMQEMVKIDYLYGANWSLWRDVKILLRTIPHALARRGL